MLHETRSQIYTQASQIRAKIRQSLTSKEEEAGKIRWEFTNQDQETVFGLITWPHRGWLLVIGRHSWLHLNERRNAMRWRWWIIPGVMVAGLLVVYFLPQ